MNTKPAAMFAWLRLLRLPNVFTAISNVSVGYFVADSGMARLPIWIGLCAASACLYWAGMVLNDYFDRQLDGVERPERPLPSGQISAAVALRAGVGLLCVGVVIALLVGWLAEPRSPWYLHPGSFAVGLALAIVTYDRWAKSTVFGPLVMGACRTLNILMGVAVTQAPERWHGSTPWMVACGIGLYVMGVTWFARDEAVQSRRPVLAGGIVLMLIGLAMLVLVPVVPSFDPALQKVVFTRGWVWPLLLCLFTATVWRQAFKALFTGAPTDVQLTIKQALMALLSIDAALALLLAGPIAAILMIALIVPMNLLGRWIAMT